MPWAELKRLLEANGVRDEDVIFSIDLFLDPATIEQDKAALEIATDSQGNLEITNA